MQLILNEQSDIQLYKQIVYQITEHIARGSLRYDDPLPSARQLASDLNINVNTVLKSYHELVEKGLIEQQPKKKARVIAHKPTSQTMTILEEALTPALAEASAMGVAECDIQQLVTNILAKWRL